MFTPAKMAKIDFQVSQEYVAKTTSILADLKKLHLMNIRKNRLGQIDAGLHTENNLQPKFYEMKTRLEKLFKVLGVDHEEEITPDTEAEKMVPQKDIFEIDQQIQQLEEQIFSLIKAIEAPVKEKEEKQKSLKQAEIFSKVGLDLDSFQKCRYLYPAIGLIPGGNLERLQLSLSNIYHVLIPSISIDKRRLAFIFGSRKDREKIDKALRSAYFEKLEMPQKVNLQQLD